MWWRFLISICVIGSLLGAVTMTARAASQRSDYLDCGEILTERQAAVSMSESEAFILNSEFVDNTRICAYFGYGGSTGEKKIGHALGVNWGPYDDVREAFESGIGKKLICGESKNACRNLKKAAALRSNTESFNSLYKALGDAEIGTAKALQSSAFEGNPAFVWKPSKAVAPLDQLAWVFVYVVKFKKLLLIDCHDGTDKTADIPCAIAAAKRAYNNITS